MRRELVESRTEAQRAIEDGRVEVASNPAPKPSTMVSANERIVLAGPPRRFVGRGGHKLDGALDAFGLDVEGLRAVDVGASTGGFTDCLLQRGASHVTAVDVGYGQLHWSLRTDDRVTVIERTNIRTAGAGDLGAPFDLVVADLSFISLRTVAAALEALGGPEASWVLLIKPQFEVGRERVGPRGIVTDERDRADAIVGVIEAFDQVGLGCQGLAVSSITGTTGNVEFVVLLTRGRGSVDTGAIEDVIEEEP